MLRARCRLRSTGHLPGCGKSVESMSASQSDDRHYDGDPERLARWRPTSGFSAEHRRLGDHAALRSRMSPLRLARRPRPRRRVEHRGSSRPGPPACRSRPQGGYPDRRRILHARRLGPDRGGDRPLRHAVQHRHRRAPDDGRADQARGRGRGGQDLDIDRRAASGPTTPSAAPSGPGRRRYRRRGGSVQAGSIFPSTHR